MLCYQKFLGVRKVPEATDPDCEIPTAPFCFWHEWRDCCGLYGYQSHPGLLIALKQMWCITNAHIAKKTLPKNPKASSLQHSILSSLSWMLFSAPPLSASFEGRRCEPAQGKSGAIWQFAALGPAWGFTGSGQTLAQGAELGLVGSLKSQLPV